MNCDRLAPWYRSLEYGAFGKELERRRLAFLPSVEGPRRVLMAGEGDGRFLTSFHQQHPSAIVDYFDLSARMLHLARRRHGSEKIRCRQADLRTAELPRCAYDLVVTHFFLDCFTQEDTEIVVSRIADAAAPNARWIVSEFRQPPVWGAAVLWGLYTFFRLSTGLKTTRLPNYHPCLERHGFRLVREQTARAGLLASELWQRRIPANGSASPGALRESG